MRDLGPYAVGYAARGWRTIPLHTPDGDKCDCGREHCRLPNPGETTSMGKHPRIRDWTHNASADVATVTEWWRRWPQANIGLATGTGSGVVVMDVDPRNGGLESILELAEKHNWAHAGPIVATGGGGWHYYFTAPDVRITNNHPFPGIDIQADGQQVVLPPSVHYTGVGYEWTENGPDSPLEPMPGWLLEAATSRPARGASEKAVGGIIGKGQRNATLASFGGSLRARGASEHVIFAALAAMNEEQCDPPLSTPEVAQIAASVARYEPSIGTVVLGSGPAAQQPKTGRPHIEPRTTSLAEIQYREYAPPRYAVKGLVPQGLCLLAGQLKSGKSWFSMGVGLAVAEGGIALGEFPCDEGDVLAICYEDPERRIHARVKQLLRDGGRWPERFEFAEQGSWPTRNDGGLEAIDAWLGQHPHARLVVIDTLQRFRAADVAEGDRNAYAADYNVAGELQELALKHEVAFLVIHHFRKMVIAEDDWVNRVSGTNGIAGAADVIMGFTAKRGGGVREATLRTTGRDIEEMDYALLWDDAKYGWYVSGTAEEAELSESAKEFTEAVWELGRGQPVHYKAIAGHLGKRGNSVVKLAGRLAERGLVESLGGGMYRCVTSVTSAKIDSKSGDRGGVTAASPPSLDNNGGGVSDAGDAVVTQGVSPDFESKNGLSDAGDAKTGNLVTALLRERGIARTDGEPCQTCGETNWLRRAAGGWVCNTCKPWRTVVDTGRGQV